MDLSFTEDQELIQESVEKYIRDNYDSEKRRNIIDNSKGYDEKTWQTFSDLGWLALPFPEKVGGYGGGLVELMILMKNFGRGLVIEPYMSSIVLSGNVLSFSPESEKRDSILSALLEGCLLYTSPSPRDGLLSRMPSSA